MPSNDYLVFQVSNFEVISIRL